MLLQIGLRGFSRNQPKIFVEAGEVVETALEAKLFDADAVIEQEFAGVADADLGDELGIGLTRAGFEIAAEGIGHQTGHRGYLVEIDLLGEMVKGIVVDGIDPVVFRFREIGLEADGRQQLQMVR